MIPQKYEDLLVVLASLLFIFKFIAVEIIDRNDGLLETSGVSG